MFVTADFQCQRNGKFGSEFYFFDQINSTNLVAEELARGGCQEGTVVLADSQTSGKGRKGNAWYSPSGCNLYFSVVLRPDVRKLHYLPFLCGMAIVNTLQQRSIHSELKWPNDVLIRNKKVCGILVQTAFEENRLQYAVAGCGLNVNEMHFPAALMNSATSMSLETAEHYSREEILAQILLEFEFLYERIDRISWNEFVQELEKHSPMLNGCDVLIQLEDRVIEGITQGLDQHGGLILNVQGQLTTVYSGDVQKCRRRI
jgi:BirA family biotin operon repressor/biotin-[acetyl-CoA-carboxylase] ligase